MITLVRVLMVYDVITASTINYISLVNTLYHLTVKVSYNALKCLIGYSVLIR